MAELVCDRLTLGYEGEALVKDLSFAVEKGNYLCIVGENGTGKSTLMRTLLHLQQPMAGTVTFGDGMKENEVGYLPQQTQVQRDFPASVREIVLSGCQARLGKRFFYNAEERKLAAENMERLGISGLAERCYRELSGGQQQRVAIARALALHPDILCFDEPTSALDPELTGEVLKVIRELAEKKTTMIIVTHEMTFARDVSDTVIFMDGGVIEEQGPAHEVIDHPKSERMQRFLASYSK